MTTTPRSRAIMLHVTEAEYGRIRAAAARFSVPTATFARIQVLLASPEAKPVRPPKPLKAVRYENLSQMHASGLYVMGPTAADGSISFVAGHENGRWRDRYNQTIEDIEAWCRERGYEPPPAAKQPAARQWAPPKRVDESALHRAHVQARSDGIDPGPDPATIAEARSQWLARQDRRREAGKPPEPYDDDARRRAIACVMADEMLGDD